MAYTQLLPVSNRNGTLDTGVQAWPPSATTVNLRIDATPFAGKSKPLNDPTLGIQVALYVSYDGGTLMLEQGGGLINGSPAGTWGKGLSNPVMSIIVQEGQPTPTHARATAVVINGPITFGVSMEIV